MDVYFNTNVIKDVICYLILKASCDTLLALSEHICYSLWCFNKVLPLLTVPWPKVRFYIAWLAASHMQCSAVCKCTQVYHPFSHTVPSYPILHKQKCAPVRVRLYWSFAHGKKRGNVAEVPSPWPRVTMIKVLNWMTAHMYSIVL